MCIRSRLATACLIVLAACATSGGSEAGPEFPPRPADHPIAVLESSPECPVADLGEVSARPHTQFSTRETVLDELREAARELGGDALVDVREDNRRHGPTVGRVVRPGDPPPSAPAPALIASVIRYMEPDCRT